MFEEEGAVVIDLRTDAAMPEMSADGGPMMSQLLGRVRRVGGDLFVDGDTPAFTVRVVLPGGAMTEGASVQQVARMRLVS